MSRKFLTLLLLLPVAVFATDKAIGAINHENPGKDPKKEVVTAETDAPVLPADVDGGDKKKKAEKAECDGGDKKPAKKVAKQKEDGGFSRTEMVAELKTSIAAFEEEHPDVDYFWGDEKFDMDETYNFLEVNLMAKIEDANVYGVELGRAFSRCPSGYSYRIVADAEGAPTEDGYVFANRGCWEVPMAKFRYNTNAKMVEMQVSEKAGYASVDLFMDLYAKAYKELEKESEEG